MKSKKMIVVIGMHRSGTSAITRGLELLGVGLGNSLHPAAADNPKGFWEDTECLEINEELLAYFESAYDQLALNWEASTRTPELSRLKLKASQLVSRKLEENTVWGFKDPRTSRLLPFWKEVFSSVGCEVSYLIALRNPVSVVDSLQKRNSTPAEKTYFLWLQHMLPALSLTEGTRRVVVDYDAFMDEPYSQMKRVADRLEMPFVDQNSAEARSFEREFLDKSLRHSRYTSAQLKMDSRAPDIVYSTYLLFLKLSRDELSLDAAQTKELVSELHASLASYIPIFDLVNSLELDRKKLWMNVSNLEALNGSLSDNIHELNETLAQITGETTRLSGDLAEAHSGIAKRDDHVAQRDTHVSQRDAHVAQRDTHIAGLLTNISDLEKRIFDLKNEINAILNSSSWKVTKPLRFVRRIFFGRLLNYLVKTFGKNARIIWHRIPVSIDTKLKAKSALFTALPSLFSKSQAYRSWYAMNFSSADVPSPVAPPSHAPASQHDYIPLLRAAPPEKLPVNLIAFYLPQFHAIKENDEWWGEGFTEWTNVKPARAQFEGHYQPHVPGELGYYNLLDRATQQRQIELAKLYGIGGFCFYYYWFGGVRLLEQPIENYLSDSTLDHPFCLCWANENWSRRWDGKDSEVLIAQQHSPEDDLAFAADVYRYMRDERYIRIDGKPLLLVYRPSLLPSAIETSERWRAWFREQGMGEIYLAYTQSFETEDPRKYGFDAAIEFPPNNSAPPNITSEVSASEGFGGTVYDWAVFLKRSRNYKKMPYHLFRSVCPSWDNTARRKNGGTIFANSNPADYQKWLENAVADTCETARTPDEKIVFVNAWNEWAEGAHLEPDAKYGYAWLDATRKALTGETDDSLRTTVAVISHDAHPHGAQFLALGIVRSLVNDLKFRVHTVLLGEGRLRGDFEQYAPVHNLLQGDEFERRAIELAKELVRNGVKHAIVNTTVSGSFVKALSSEGIRCVCLIHEMPGVIESNNLSEQAKAIASFADRVVFPAEIVEQGFTRFAEVEPSRKIIRPQGLWRRNLLRFDKDQVRKNVLQRLGAMKDQPIVLAVGYADRRKGIDLFVKAALEVLVDAPDTLFVWIGHWDEALRPEIDALVAGQTSSFKFLGYEPDTASYHVAANVYALTSREDPFPNVVLESFDAGVPVVAFNGSGGGAKFASSSGGRVVPMEDFKAFAAEILFFINHPEVAQDLGRQASALVDREYAFRSYLFDLCKLSEMNLPRISVIVPNYNYAKYIGERLDSIVGQSLPIYELIILDDASTDDSVVEIKKWLTKNKIECRLILNQENSRNVFDQWAKGVAEATGDYVWIAEADDLSAPRFLETVIAPMERDNKIAISYCESQQIDGRSQLLSNDYQAYREDVCGNHWTVPYVADGDEEIVKFMAVKNTIPNVSGVLLRREAVASVFADSLSQIRALTKAGDWLTYIKIMKGAKVAFSPRPLNFHRRHAGSVIGGSHAGRLLEEIEIVQKLVAEEYPLPENIAQQADLYIEMLRSQFNIQNRVSL
jgi:glycosyltransferase involved in cell wall biosynthesis